MVLLLEHCFSKMSFYLVYDGTDASLSMVGCVPDSLKVIPMCMPFPKRTSDGAYQLFFLARERDDGRLPLASPPFLCVFSPVTVTGTGTNWNVPVSVFKRFRPSLFKTRASGPIVSQALIYCNLDTTSDLLHRVAWRVPA